MKITKYKGLNILFKKKQVKLLDFSYGILQGKKDTKVFLNFMFVVH